MRLIKGRPFIAAVLIYLGSLLIIGISSFAQSTPSSTDGTAPVPTAGTPTTAVPTTTPAVTSNTPVTSITVTTVSTGTRAADKAVSVTTTTAKKTTTTMVRNIKEAKAVFAILKPQKENSKLSYFTTKPQKLWRTLWAWQKEQKSSAILKLIKK